MNPDGDKNQNTSNGTPNADPTQRAIFTPNSAPASSNQSRDSSVVTGSVVEPASAGLSHPYLSNHPTQTFASETGDIIINNTKPQPKSKKKFWIIGGIVGVGVAIILLACVVLLTSKSKNENTLAGIDHELYMYGNYLFSGSDSSQKISNPPSYYSTYFYNTLFTSDDPLEYLKDVEDKFGTFQEQYQDFRTKINNESAQLTLDDSVNLNSIQIKNLKQFLENASINEADMLSLYISHGGSAMVQTVKESYSDLANSDSALLANIGSNEITLAETLKNIYDKYSARGCISNNELDNTCIAENFWSADFSEQQAKVTELQNEMDSNYRQLVINVISACWNTINIFNGLEIK